MEVYQTNQDGYYVGSLLADPDPLEPGNWLIPGGCVTTPPPTYGENELPVWNGSEWQVVAVEPEPDPNAPIVLTPEQELENLLLNITAERNFRMRNKVWFDGNLYDSDEGSLQRITGAATLAGFAIANGAQSGDLLWHGGTQPFVWITAENTLTPMDAQTMFAFGQRAAEHESLHIFAARALKDMDPVPTDYQNDAYWPPLIPEQP